MSHRVSNILFYDTKLFVCTNDYISKVGGAGSCDPPARKSRSVFMSCVTCVRSCARVILGGEEGLQKKCVLLLFLLLLCQKSFPWRPAGVPCEKSVPQCPAGVLWCLVSNKCAVVSRWCPVVP